jgi:hypothetical protein
MTALTVSSYYNTRAGLTDVERTFTDETTSRSDVTALARSHPERGTVPQGAPSPVLIRYVGDIEPPWFRPAAEPLADLLNLPPNWDSYGARAVQPTNVVAGLQLLLTIMRDDTPVPFAAPTCRGGVQFEWSTQGIDLEIEIASTSRFHVSFENHKTGEEWERELSADLKPLTECISALSNRT